MAIQTSGSISGNPKTTQETPLAKSDTIMCDLENPTRARRIIYDGIPGSMKQIVVNRGDTKRGVTLSRAIAEELRDRNRTKKNSDLIIKPQATEAAA